MTANTYPTTGDGSAKSCQLRGRPKRRRMPREGCPLTYELIGCLTCLSPVTNWVFLATVRVHLVAVCITFSNIQTTVGVDKRGRAVC